MLPATPKCVFCLTTTGSFARDEHPIPESLGNDDFILPPGCVCDDCNLYFGTKIEKEVLTHAPFGIMRASQCVKNKNGKRPRIDSGSVQFQSTGFWNQLFLASDPPHENLIVLDNNTAILNPKWTDPNMLVRFLLKIGMELMLVTEKGDPYHSRFDLARRCARYGVHADKWDFAMGAYPDREGLILSRREDEFGPLETRQLYRWHLSESAEGQAVFSFMYERFYFAVSHTRMPVLEYIMAFNAINSFHLRSRWKLFQKVTKPHMLKHPLSRRRR